MYFQTQISAEFMLYGRQLDIDGAGWDERPSLGQRTPRAALRVAHFLACISVIVFALSHLCTQQVLDVLSITHMCSA